MILETLKAICICMKKHLDLLKVEVEDGVGKSARVVANKPVQKRATNTSEEEFGSTRHVATKCTSPQCYHDGQPTTECSPNVSMQTPKPGCFCNQRRTFCLLA